MITLNVDPADKWTLDLTLRTDGIPAVVNNILGEYGLTLKHAGPRGDSWHGVAVVDG